MMMLMKEDFDNHFLCKFNWCIYGVEEEQMFEEQWKVLLEKYNVEDNHVVVDVHLQFKRKKDNMLHEKLNNSCDEKHTTQ